MLLTKEIDGFRATRAGSASSPAENFYQLLHMQNFLSWAVITTARVTLSVHMERAMTLVKTASVVLAVQVPCLVPEDDNLRPASLGSRWVGFTEVSGRY